MKLQHEVGVINTISDRTSFLPNAFELIRGGGCEENLCSSFAGVSVHLLMVSEL